MKQALAGPRQDPVIAPRSATEKPEEYSLESRERWPSPCRQWLQEKAGLLQALRTKQFLFETSWCSCKEMWSCCLRRAARKHPASCQEPCHDACRSRIFLRASKMTLSSSYHQIWARGQATRMREQHLLWPHSAHAMYAGVLAGSRRLIRDEVGMRHHLTAVRIRNQSWCFSGSSQ